MINLANVFLFTDKPGSPEEQWYYQHQMLRPTWCHYCTVSHHAFLSYIMSTPFIFFSSSFFHLFFDFLGTFTPGAADLMLLWLKRRARAKTKSVARIHVLRGWGCRGEGFPWKHTHTGCTGNVQLHWKHFHPCKSADLPEIMNPWCLWDFCEGELNPIRNQCLPWHHPTNLGPRGRRWWPAWLDSTKKTLSSSERMPDHGVQVFLELNKLVTRLEVLSAS